jgi:hypothetical protein
MPTNMGKRERSKDNSPEDGSVPDGRKRPKSDEGVGAWHLKYWHRHSYAHEEMDGSQIPLKFAQLEGDILIAADTLSRVLEAKKEWTLNLEEYASDDVEVLEAIPTGNLLQSMHKNGGIDVVRMFIGWSLYRWIFRTPFLGCESYQERIKEIVRQVCLCNAKSRYTAFGPEAETDCYSAAQQELQSVVLSQRILKDTYGAQNRASEHMKIFMIHQNARNTQ